MEKIKKICKLEYVFMAYNLVFVLYMLAAIPIEVIVAGKYSLVVFAGSLFVGGLAVYACVKAKCKVSALHLLAIAFYLWVLLSAVYRAGDSSIDNTPHILLLFCLVGPSFLSFLSFTKAQYIAQWQVMAVGYNAAVSVLSAVGIWCALADVYLSFPAVGFNYIAFVDLKLYILTHYNGVGHFLAFAMILAMFMMANTRKNWVRVVFALEFALFYVTLALTYSRTVELTMAACIGIAIAYGIWHSKKIPSKFSAVGNVLLRLAICGVAFVATVAVGYSSMVAINTQAHAYVAASRIAQGTSSSFKIEVISAQAAQEEVAVSSTLTLLSASAQTEVQIQADAQPTVASVMQPLSATPDRADSAAQGMTDEEYTEYLQEARSLSDLSTMETRVYYWTSALDYFVQDLEYLLIGTSPAGVVAMLAQAIEDANPPHAHNVFVQVLVALGVVGFLLFVAFWGVALFFAAKLFFQPSASFAQGCLPLLLILAFTAMGLQENMMFSSETSLMLPAFFMGCASVAHCLQQGNAVAPTSHSEGNAA